MQETHRFLHVIASFSHLPRALAVSGSLNDAIEDVAEVLQEREMQEAVDVHLPEKNKVKKNLQRE